MWWVLLARLYEGSFSDQHPLSAPSRAPGLPAGAALGLGAGAGKGTVPLIHGSTGGDLRLSLCTRCLCRGGWCTGTPCAEELGGNAWGGWWGALKAKGWGCQAGLSRPVFVIELTPCLE